MPAKKNANLTWDEMSLAEFLQRIERVTAGAKQFVSLVNAELPGLPELTTDDRVHAFRPRKDQIDGYLAALDVADKRPETFKFLADKDKGKDPTKFETDLVRERVLKHRALTELNKVLAPVGDLTVDGPLWLAMQFGETCSATYKLAKSLADVDPGARTIMAKALSKNARPAAAAAKTRAAKKAVKKSEPK